jgi:hypothetical protein
VGQVIARAAKGRQRVCLPCLAENARSASCQTADRRQRSRCEAWSVSWTLGAGKAWKGFICSGATAWAKMHLARMEDRAGSHPGQNAGK